METTIQINGKDVKITLTKDQISAIKKASQEITERVKSFDDICKEANTTEKNFKAKYSVLDAQGYAAEQIKLIVKVLNEEWTPNFNDTSENKYYLWYDMRGEGSLFRLCYCTYAFYAPASFLVKSRTLQEFAYSTFEEIYRVYFKG